MSKLSRLPTELSRTFATIRTRNVAMQEAYLATLGTEYDLRLRAAQLAKEGGRPEEAYAHIRGANYVGEFRRRLRSMLEATR